jgi:hypothetical protein
MQLRDGVEDIAALEGVLAAATALLEHLRTARTPDERAALGADFEAAVLRLRAELVRCTGGDRAAADACLGRALLLAAEQVASVPARG